MSIYDKAGIIPGILLLLLASPLTLSAQDPEARLREKGIELPVPPKPIANYVHAVKSGNLLFLAGKGPSDKTGNYITGKLGRDLSLKQGQDAARLAGINLLAVLKEELGELSRVKRIVKVLGMVNSDAEFTDHPAVMNGFSDLMVEIFGEKGRHARSAVGMCSLPRNMAVEIEMVVEVE